MPTSSIKVYVCLNCGQRVEAKKQPDQCPYCRQDTMVYWKDKEEDGEKEEGKGNDAPEFSLLS